MLNHPPTHLPHDPPGNDQEGDDKDRDLGGGANGDTHCKLHSVLVGNADCCIVEGGWVWVGLVGGWDVPAVMCSVALPTIGMRITPTKT